MRCTKCGNEIRDGVKFCPQCGEEVKEEKRMKFCTRCGSELQEEAVFCAKCGASIGTVQKEGVPARPTKRNNKHKKIFMIVGIVLALLLIIGCIMLNSEKAMYKAYVKFHKEYCDKREQYDEYNDCAARIIMSPKNEKWLAIWDITNFRYDSDGYMDSITTKTTLYHYSWGKVKEVATFWGNSEDEALPFFSVIDNELYVFFVDNGVRISESNNLEGVYRLNDNKFETVKVKEEGTGDDIEYITDFGTTFSDFDMFSGYFSDVWNCDRYRRQLECINGIFTTTVSEFANVVDELSEYKIKNQVDLQIAYGNIFKEFGWIHFSMNDYFVSTDYPVVGIVKTKYGYYAVRTSGNAALLSVNDGKDLYKALQSADGRKVTRIEGVGDVDVSEDLKIPEGITYINGFVGQKKLKNIELPDSVKEIGEDAFYNCDNLQQIEIPDTVEKIGRYAFYNEDGILDSILPVIVASKGSYAQEYAEKNDLDWSEKKLSKAEIEERELIGEALKSYQNYVDDWDGETELLGMALAYINADNIPECILWAYIDPVYYSNNNILLSYTADGIIEEELGFSQSGYEGIKYGSKAGKICRDYWVNGYGENYIIYSFDKELVPFAEINDFMAAAEPEYTVNGENYGSHEAIEEYISSLGLVSSFSEEDVCDNVKEAYNKLKRVN